MHVDDDHCCRRYSCTYSHPTFAWFVGSSFRFAVDRFHRDQGCPDFLVDGRPLRLPVNLSPPVTKQLPSFETAYPASVLREPAATVMAIIREIAAWCLVYAL